jgi:HD domain-containing protein
MGRCCEPPSNIVSNGDFPLSGPSYHLGDKKRVKVRLRSPNTSVNLQAPALCKIFHYIFPKSPRCDFFTAGAFVFIGSNHPTATRRPIPRLTGEHTWRVGKMAAQIAQALDWTNVQVELIGRAAPLHDIGKIAILDSVLLKAGRLTPEEYEQMNCGCGRRVRRPDLRTSI